jgi:hypothetical protein
MALCLFHAHRDLLPARLRTFVNFCIQFFGEERAESAPELAATLAGPRRRENRELIAV